MDSINRLNQALEYVEETLESQIDNAVFSRIAACPMAVFQRFFVLVTGTTFNEYVRLRRLSRAAEEILDTQNRLMDIALKYGYESSDAFCVAFKRAYGMTPTAARKKRAVLPPYDRICFTLSISYVKEDKKMSGPKNQLELVAKSYDRGVDYGRRGIDLYKELPEHITNDPDYIIHKKIMTEGEMTTEGGEFSGCSGHEEIREYLAPAKNMKLIDLGCCLNLMFNGYDRWPSTYHGVDISRKTIELLHEFVAKNKISVGSLYCGSIHETPFDADYFDIGACIGVLEYFNRDFVEKAIAEAHRILKPCGKLVLDIPNIASPACRGMMLIEAHLGRPEKFDMLPLEFEDMLRDYFEIERADKEETWAMFQYFLRCKK